MCARNGIDPILKGRYEVTEALLLLRHIAVCKVGYVFSALSSHEKPLQFLPVGATRRAQLPFAFQTCTDCKPFFPLVSVRFHHEFIASSLLENSSRTLHAHLTPSYTTTTKERKGTKAASDNPPLTDSPFSRLASQCQRQSHLHCCTNCF